MARAMFLMPAGWQGESLRNCSLQGGWCGEGQILVHAGNGFGEWRRGANPADFPAGEREELARRADLDASIPQRMLAQRRAMAFPAP